MALREPPLDFVHQRHAGAAELGVGMHRDPVEVESAVRRLRLAEPGSPDTEVAVAQDLQRLLLERRLERVVLERLAVDREPAAEIFQIWGFDRAAGRWRVDMMIEPGTDDGWVYKRATEIRRPRSEMVMRTAGGIPYLNPSAVLLFKAKYQRPKDEADFAAALPKLAAPERTWLRDCLELLHPGHGWTKAL